MALVSDVNVSNSPIMASISAKFADFTNKLQSYRQYRITVNELSNLSDHDLADLGIHRSQIRSIALDTAKTA